MAFSMKSAMRSAVVVAAMAMVAIVESHGFVAADAPGSAAAPTPGSYASALMPSVAAPAIMIVLSYVTLRHL
ncbi:unnamed protein product [Calypogeia fissa]